MFSSAVTRANRSATFAFSACNCRSTSCKAAVETAHIASLFKLLKSWICSPCIYAPVTLVNLSLFCIVITLLPENESTGTVRYWSLSVVIFIFDVFDKVKPSTVVSKGSSSTLLSLVTLTFEFVSIFGISPSPTVTAYGKTFATSWAMKPSQRLYPFCFSWL